MSAVIRFPFLSQAARCWAALFLVSTLVGCATAYSGGTAPVWSQKVTRHRGPQLTMAPLDVVLAMTDNPAAGGGPSGSVVRGYNVPGRNPDSQMPWEFFLGNASHRLIAYMYGVSHPSSRIYYNNKSLKTILGQTSLGDPSLLTENQQQLCPDITDIFIRVLFEIKPRNERGRQEGREEAGKYLVLLNRALLVGRKFTGGTDFDGEILIRFAGGQYIWRLEWNTPEPGVTLYRWTRSQQPFDSEAEAYKAAQWVDLTEVELRQYGGWVEKAVEGMVSRREQLATARGSVGLVIDLVGGVATTVLWGAILGQSSTGPKAQPPTQAGGHVIPFPAKPPPVAPVAPMPAASGMPLPR